MALALCFDACHKGVFVDQHQIDAGHRDNVQREGGFRRDVPFSDPEVIQIGLQ